MKKHEKCGCQEYRRVSRRNFMKSSGTVAVAAAMPAWVPRVVLADSHASERDVLVSVFLRGGVDSLSVVVPFNEAQYYKLRPGIAIPPPDAGGKNAALALDPDFGFAPAMRPLLGAYENGDLLVVHATGLETPTRSHFEAMNFMEIGQDSPPGSLFSGWLGRHLAATAPTREDAILRAVGIGYGLQRTLVGGPHTLPIEDLADFGIGGPPVSAKARQATIEAMYGEHTDPLATAAVNTTQTIDLLRDIDFDGYKPKGGASYPNSDFGYALKSTAALIKADVGVEAVAIDLGGWDTHDDQGPLNGWMMYLMADLAEGLAAFHADMAASGREDFALMAMSEFGRNVFENGSDGTDHGHGGMMMALGGNIAGGKVLTEWPGLQPGQLYDRQDLAITIDYRDVISEILTRRAGNPDPATIFPDSSYAPKTWGVVA